MQAWVGKDNHQVFMGLCYSWWGPPEEEQKSMRRVLRPAESQWGS